MGSDTTARSATDMLLNVNKCQNLPVGQQPQHRRAGREAGLVSKMVSHTASLSFSRAGCDPEENSRQAAPWPQLCPPAHKGDGPAVTPRLPLALGRSLLSHPGNPRQGGECRVLIGSNSGIACRLAVAVFTACPSGRFSECWQGLS